MKNVLGIVLTQLDKKLLFAGVILITVVLVQVLINLFYSYQVEMQF